MRHHAAVVTSFLFAAAVVAAQAPFEGEWAGTGGTRLVLKTDAAGLTGNISGGPGLDATMAIERGSVNGRTATFTTTRTVDGNVVTMQWTATLTGDDTIALTRQADFSAAGRDGRGRAGGAAGRGGRGMGPRAGGRGGRAGRGGGRAGTPPREPEAGPNAPADDPPAGRGGRSGGEGRGRVGAGERGRAAGAGRGPRGEGAARAGRDGGAPRGGDPAGGFPEMLQRVR
jgi:hypothetical protein